MAKRFGRNQKRRMREQIATLQRDKEYLTYAKNRAELLAENAKHEAFNRFLEDSGIYEDALRNMSAHLGHALGERLRPHAQTLLRASRDTRKLDIQLMDRPEQATFEVTVIRASVPSLHIEMKVAR